MDRLHPVCLESRELWTAGVPLICFNIVEWHHPIRVMRQFGWKQMIPPTSIEFTNEHHGLERKKRVDWRVHLHQYVALWSSRYERLINGDLAEDAEDIDIPSDEYVYWYSRITRHLIQPKLEEEDTQIRTLFICASQAAEGFSSDDDDMSLDDDHVTNLDSQTASYDHPSSSRAPPSPPFWVSTSQAPPSPPFQPSTSQAPPSPPAHGHQLRTQK
ncbi:hypothetical protein QQ045_032577 [Rhodiola kirilowii]